MDFREGCTMTATLLRQKLVKARVEHGCLVCTGTAIHAGETYLRSTYAYDGRVYDWVLCSNCEAMTSDVWDWSNQDDDGIGADTYYEWASEYRDDPRSIELYRRMGWK